MNRLHILAAVFASAVVVFGTIPYIISYREDLPEADPVTFWFFVNDTIYSTDYSERVFLELEQGISESEAIKRLGLPLTISGSNHTFFYNSSHRSNKYPFDLHGDISTDHRQILEKGPRSYCYSQQRKPSSNWHMRCLLFSSDGLLKEKHASFIVD